ncbi:hypothetical protein MVES1_003034 [Malassezia vespertilionis]|uniref:Ribosomal RNA-processing protein 42 n=1 Tax=Malassezia vespertilionis TaxID=2020962 RepID=A0A2N1J8W3_9BASI|nr:uncharacterized protein MVES1_003034 [Malassezia vespertilionis]PKI82974.1 hypothetical protein MVES_002875 [Malassezia vespertilionis]WFD07665.1 hypothetical protein MVES1_003034 [Malassezia vespertilionis]
MSNATLSRAEQNYVLDGLALPTPQRQDGRKLEDYRPISVEAPFSEQANGSARVSIDGTQVLCGVKLEMEAYDPPHVTVQDGKMARDFAPLLPPLSRVQVGVEYSPALLHSHTPQELSVLSTSVQDMLNACFGLHGDALGPLPVRQFIVVPYAKFWLMRIDVYVLSWSGGNVLDTLFASVFAALWNTKLPKTKLLSVDKAVDALNQPVLTDDDHVGMKYITRGRKNEAASTGATDFALENEWEDGVSLEGRSEVPVCISVYPVGNDFLLDPRLEEESALRVSISVLCSASGKLYGVQQRGDGEVTMAVVDKAIQAGIHHAKQLAASLKTFGTAPHHV